VDDDGDRMTFTGDLTNVDPRLFYGDVYANCTANISAWTVCYYFENNCPVTLTTVVGMTHLGYAQFAATVLLPTALVNQIAADFWANRDYSKTYSDASRILDMSLNPLSGAPSGQGITDIANLRLYRSPNNLPQYALWTVLTR
jgi:hypothetical protein